MKQKKSFCKGLFCYKHDRKFKCCVCGVYMCTKCTVVYKTKKENKIFDFCIDCFVMQKLGEFNDKYEYLFSDKEEMTELQKDKKIVHNYITEDNRIQI